MQSDRQLSTPLLNLTPSLEDLFPIKLRWYQYMRFETTSMMGLWSAPAQRVTASIFLCLRLTLWEHLMIQASTTQLASTISSEPSWTYSTKWSNKSTEFQKSNRKFYMKFSKSKSKRDASLLQIKMKYRRVKLTKAFGWRNFIANWRIKWKQL